MHKSDPKLAADKQGKRSVVTVERGDYDQWLTGRFVDAMAMLRVPPIELFDATPA